MRWLAIYLPLLPLQSLVLQDQGRLPLAVSETRGRQQRILLCNPAAADAGVSPGMPVSAARVLADELRVFARDARREDTALQGLALWAGRFSSQVSLVPPAGLLLELGGSLRLFGGVAKLLPLIRSGLDDLGYRARLCLAPTAAGALLLAQSGKQGVVGNLQELRQALALVPLRRLSLDEQQLRALEAIGLTCLGELLRLPRDGLGRRLGREFMDYLQRLLGHAADPRRLFQPPERFRRRLQLPAEVADSDALMFAARRLILELCGFLTARQAGAQCLRWLLHHAEGAPSGFYLGLLSPQREPERLQQLLGARLERLTLSAPVQAVSLQVNDVQPLAGRPLALFDSPTQAPESGAQLLERLRARLGQGVVSGIRLLPDHRPEKAWCPCPPGRAWTGRAMAGRPLWLLAVPLPLEQRHGRPWRGGRLTLEPERERIESGWWDGQPVARDYFVAHSRQGEVLWIYRELHGHRCWYLHGLF